MGENREYQRPFLIRIADQLLPSLVTALAVGWVSLKVMEERVTANAAKMAEIEVEVSKAKSAIDIHNIQIAQLQERNLAVAERLNVSIQSLNDTLKQLDSRLRSVESSKR
ncbi:MAG: hypothetical protein E6R03_11690 [Hyphomicrobiaceae bacterium]|nr:MAG: hypothetical protein E6R03_11690 [Hyphomicrobiaceae bacterium]